MREYPKKQNQHHAGTTFWDRGGARDARSGYGKSAPSTPAHVATTAHTSRDYSKGNVKTPGYLKPGFKHQMVRHFEYGGYADRGYETGPSYESPTAGMPDSMASDMIGGATNSYGADSYGATYGGGGYGASDGTVGDAVGAGSYSGGGSYGEGGDSGAGAAYGEGAGAANLGGGVAADATVAAQMAQSYERTVPDERARAVALEQPEEQGPPAAMQPEEQTVRTPTFRESEIQAGRMGQAYSMANAMIGEARNQGPAGMAAVGNVLANRADFRDGKPGREGYLNLGTTVQDQLTRAQFSYLGDQNKKVADKAMTTPLGDQAYEIAKGIMNKTLPDNTNGALSYRAKDGFDRSYNTLKNEYGAQKIGDHYYTEFAGQRPGVEMGPFPDDYEQKVK